MNPTTPPSLPDHSAARSSSLAWFLRTWDAAGMLAIYALLLAVCFFTIPDFFGKNHMLGLAQIITSVGIVACGMLFCLASGDFDLSVGSVAALGGVVAVIVVNETHSITLAIGAGLAVGALVGFVNGFIIAALKINALITTLATMQIVRGLAFMASNGTVGSTDRSFNKLFSAYTLAEIPTPVWLMAACFLAFGLLLHKTTFGRNTLAVGGNYEAARLAGVATVRTRITIFMLQGMLAALAGIVGASQSHIGDPKEFTGLELRVISACVLGGVALTGGVATILAAIVGTLIMGTVQYAMNAKNIETFYQYLVSGGILLAAVLYDRLKQRVMRN